MTAPASGWRPGYQAERTALAWTRAALSLLVAAGVATRLALLAGSGWLLLLALLALLLALAAILLWWQSTRRTTQRIGTQDLVARRAPGAMLAVVGSVCCLGAAGLGLALMTLFG